MKSLHSEWDVPGYETTTGADAAEVSRVEAADPTEHHVIEFLYISFDDTPLTRPVVQILHDDVVVFADELDVVKNSGPYPFPKHGWIGPKGAKLEVKVTTAGSGIATTMNSAIS